MRKTQICLAAMIAFLSGVSIAAQNVFRITLNQAIQPITEEYVVNSIAKANADHASLILLDLDTPGGYVDSVEKIQKAVLASRAPVVAYVTPSGARAASGGAYIAITCDLLVMAPGTNIGAAHPVSMFSIPTPPPSKPGEAGKKGQPSHPQGSVEMEKIVNDLAAHMRTIAVNRHRNAELAEKMVRQSISLTEQEALKGGLIDLIADSPQQIFEYVNTHPIRRFNGEEEKISLGNTPHIVDLNMTLRERFLSGLANPSLAFILLILGALGLFVEFKSPGLIFPGVLGAIFILLFVLSTPILPPNVVGLLLIILGIIFFVLEIKIVSYGMLTIGGVISLIVGSMLLYSSGPVPELRLSFYVTLPVVLAFSGIVVFLLTLVARTYRHPVTTGQESIIGREGTVKVAVSPKSPGKVLVFGEYWNAVSDSSLEPGERIRVVSREGMVLKVVPYKKGENDAQH